ncbi:MAG: acyltransferase [Oscillospiraceae bacterium]
MRKHGIDWLRIILVLLLFPFHTARVFDQWEPNYVKDTTNAFSSWFVASVGFWPMALLFIIAGFSTFWALQKRSTKAYIKERVHRLMLPFLFGLILIVPVQGYYASVQHEGFNCNYLQVLGRYFLDFHDISGYTGGLTVAHLWFIVYLFVISLCMLPLLIRISRPSNGEVRPWLWLLAFVPLSEFQALPAIGGQNIFYYAAWFLLGFLLARNGKVLEWVRRIRFITLTVAVIIIPVYVILASSFGWPSKVDLLGACFALLRNLGVWMISLSLIGFADTYTGKTSPLLNYLNRASFPVYVLHQSVLIVIAYYIVGTNMPFVFKYFSIMLGALISSFVLYEIFRHFAPTRFILGIKDQDSQNK